MHRDRHGAALTAVYSMLQDRTGAVWISHGDLTRYADGRYVRIHRASTTAELVTSLFEDKSGRVWVGTGQGLRYVENGRLERFDDPSGFLRDAVLAMLEDRHGVLWFATNAGLVRLDAGRFTRYTTRDGLPHDRVSALIETRSGALWIGTSRGVARLHDGAFTALTEKDGFIGNQVRAFHESADGVVWAGTYDGGLYRLADGRLTRYTRREGLHDNGVFQIFEDRHGYFWIGSNTGIYRVDPRELNELAAGRRRVVTSLMFGTRDGLAMLEVNGGSPPGFASSDGRLWFPTMGGVAVVDPAAVRDDLAPARPLIEEFRFAGESKELGQEVRLPSGADAFEIRYTAPTFINPEQVRFQYRLQGLSDQWEYAGERRTASFYGIPAGTYTFAVTASNHLGASSPVAATLRIVVPPRFWGTSWFRLAVLGALGLTLGAVHVGRVRRLRREQARRSVYLQELIDSQERERARISNEMHDSLGHDLAIVRRRVREGLARPIADEATSRDFSDILAVTDRLDAEMKAIAYALRPYHLDKIGLCRSIEALVAETAAMSGLDLGAEVADIDGLLPPDSEIHLYRIVQESLTNVIKHARARRATVRVTRAAEHVEVRVEDDGDGISIGDSVADREGFGLIGIRERVQLLGGTLEIVSTPRRGMALVVRVTVSQVRA